MMGSIPLGQFEIEARIGLGGMAEVWRGVHRAQGVEVAVKVMTPVQAREPDCHLALSNEVRAVARLEHPCIVMVFDCGRISPATEAASQGVFVADSPYLVMEYASMGSLDRVKKPLSWPELRSILRAILDALAFAHARGVIHLDLKPANVLMAGPRDSRPGLKLTDFGIAHALGEKTDMSSTERPAGTPHYMAPEQLQGHWRDYGPWTDLYALGCMAYELATAEVPFAEKQYLRLAQAHFSRAPRSLAHPEQFPAGFQDWLFRLLEKEPYQRFQRAADAASALKALDDQRGAHRVPLPIRLSSAKTVELASIDWISLSRTWFDRDTVARCAAPDDDTWDHTMPDRAGSIPPARVDACVDVPKAWDERVDSIFAPSEFPPLPMSWHRPGSPTTPVRLIGAGLGLYGFRQVSFVDRNAERNAIWEALRRIVRRNRSEVLLLEGTSGVGKSRLVEWMCERASELGAATVLKAVHSPIAGPGDGLPRMIARHLRCVGLSRMKTIRRIETLLKRQAVEDPYEWYALTQLIHPSSEQEPAADEQAVRFSHPTQRYALIVRLIHRLSRERPVIVWLDDVQWGADALSFVQYLLWIREMAQVRVLVLMTLTQEALAERPLEANLVASLSANPHVSTYLIHPLERADQPELVRNLLHFESELADRIEERTGGNPLFAVQLVGDWVRRGVLEIGAEGFVLKAGEKANLPDDIHGVWNLRIERLLEEYSRGRSTVGAGRAATRLETEVALELAAVLGHEVDREEWGEICDRAGVPCPVELWEHLASIRLANPTESGWAFAHAMLRESLERRSREAGRWPAQNVACAAMLKTRYPPETPGVSQRLGLHLVEACELESSLDPLLDSATERWKQAEYKQALWLLGKYDEAIDRLALPPDDPRRARGWLCRSRVLIHQTDFDGARFWAERSAGVARAIDSPEILGHSLLLLGATHLWRGIYTEAIGSFEGALDLFEGLGDEDGVAQSLHNLGHSMRRQGNLSEAAAYFEQACERFERAHDPDRAIHSTLGLAGVALQQEDIERAVHLIEGALGYCSRVGRRHTLVNCYNQLGEAQRLQGNLDAAEGSYRRAIVLTNTLGILQGDIIPRLNLDYIRLERKQYDSARISLEAMAKTCREQGLESLLGIIQCPLLAAIAAQRDWEAWDEHMEHAKRQLDLTGAVERDTAWALHLAAHLARDAGQEERASQAFSLAMGLWEKLGVQPPT